MVIVLNTQSIKAKPQEVIYDKDNRVETNELTSELFTLRFAATAAMIPANNLLSNPQNQNLLQLKGNSLQDEFLLCSDVRFGKQLSLSQCSGFLVAEDLILTAGHCLEESSCEKNKWVFDYSFNNPIVEEGMIQRDNVYSCKEVVSKVFSKETSLDYALVRLDRSVSHNRVPMPYRFQGDLALNEELFVIGHPNGIPQKFAGDARVLEHTDKGFFFANLDTFEGNSGSPVINMSTGIVEGILVRGEDDYRFDPNRGCFVVNECDEQNCSGEEVVYITEVKELYI